MTRPIIMRHYKLIMKWVIVIFYMMMMGIMFMQVVARYLFNLPTSWAEEASRYLFIWIAYLGVAAGISRKVHIGVDYFMKYLAPPIRKRIFYITSALTLGMLLVVMVQGIRLTAITMAFPSYTMEFLPQGIAFLAIPAGAFLMMLATVEAIFETIKGNGPLQKKKEEGIMIE